MGNDAQKALDIGLGGAREIGATRLILSKFIQTPTQSRSSEQHNNNTTENTIEVFYKDR